jgi:hypothetical protein
VPRCLLKLDETLGPVDAPGGSYIVNSDCVVDALLGKVALTGRGRPMHLLRALKIR